MNNTFFPLTFSDTDITALSECSLRWFRLRCEHWKTPQEQKSIHLLAGAAYAKALEVSRKSFYSEKLTINQSIRDGLDALSHELKDYNVSSTEVKTPERIRLAYQQYHKLYPMDNDIIEPITLADGSKAIEISFCIPLNVQHPELETPLMFKGKLDMLVRHSRLGKIYTYDDKTTSSLSRHENKAPNILKIKNKYLTASQHIGYNFASRSLGVKSSGTIIREVCFSKIYGIEHVEVEDILYSDFMVENWKRSLERRLQFLSNCYSEFLKNGINPEKYFSPTFKDECTFFTTPCAFMEPCRLENGMNFIKQNMVQQIWDSESQQEISVIDMREKMGLL